MAVPIRHKVNVKIDGLKRGNRYLNQELAKAGKRIGTHLQGKVREKQRVDTGQERKRTLWRSRAKNSHLTVTVYNTVVQALVDETGARWRGTQPPSHPGSKLYAWVERKGLTSRTEGTTPTVGDETARVAFLVARAIGRRGLPRPGDQLRKPFETTRKEERRAVLAMVDNAIFQSVKRMNQD